MKLWFETNTWQSKNAAEKLAQLHTCDVKKIAVIKHAAFGDMLLLRPFLLELRGAFPDATITLSVISHYQRGLPEDLVDHIHIVPSTKEQQGIRQSYHAYKKLGSQDLLFDLTASTRSFLLSRITRAKFKIGFQYRGLHRFIYDIAIPRAAYRFEAGTFLEQLCPLGLNYKWPPQFAMPVTAAKRNRPYIVYFPTASTPAKSWPIEKFSDLIRNMAVELSDHDHLVLSGIAEWEIHAAEDIMSGLPELENVHHIKAGPEDQAILKGARLLVSNDTGMRHLGIALDTTTVCIFFTAPPYRYWPRYGRHQVVYNADATIPEWQDVAKAMQLALYDRAI